MYKDLFFVTSLSRLYFDIMELQPIQIETLNIFFNQNVKSAATIYHILLCSIYNIPRSFYYLLFGRRITSPFFCSLSKRWKNYTHQANVSALLFYFYSQMDCALLQTFYGWLFFCIWTITTLSGISWIILSIMAACIQQLIAFWFAVINYRSSRYIWEFAAFLNVRKEGSA